MRADHESVVRAPFDGRELGRVPRCTTRDVDDAVRVASSALRAAPFPAWRRAQVLDVAARRLRDEIEGFASLIAAEAAKPIRTARTEVRRAISTFEFAAGIARDLHGDVVPMDAAEVGEGKLAFTLRVPIGVVGAITPFNFPLNLVAHKVAPAIAAGCPVVLKPAAQTPLSALQLTHLLEECDLPTGYLMVVTGDGATVGSALVDHPDVAMITFTGSAAVGWGIKSRAPRKRVALELGNNAPVIVEPDANIETAAERIVLGGFSYAGQTCISTQRVYVHESVREHLLDLLVSHAERLVIGDPLDDATDLSTVISASERDRITSWIAEATDAGAGLACGGRVADGILLPTVLVDVRPGMKVSDCEVFGPVVAVQTYRDLDEAIRLANDSRFGLQAAIFTLSLASALRAVRELDFGGVLVNEVPTFRADHMPYGGLRDSGNTREGPRHAATEMTTSRLAIFDTTSLLKRGSS